MSVDITGAEGARIFIGPTTAAADVSAYAALSYTEILGVESIPEFGNADSVNTFTALKDGIVRKRKGSKDSGTITIPCAYISDDPGQVAAVAARATKFTYAIKVTLADAGDANDTDSTFYFHALVTSAKVVPGAANATVMRNIELAIDTEVFEDPSAAVS